MAVRMRPRSLDELVGQEHVLGEGSALRTAIESGRPHSAILYGPPGSGKTTLARIAAAGAEGAFEEESAVNAGRAEIRAVIERARERRTASGRPTVLFLDEIHRFNKAQQDALLPAVEEGLVTLIGATTENPSFEVNSALLSRVQIYELQPLGEEELRTIVTRGAEALEAELTDEVVALVARRAGGDARNALNILELAAQTARAEGVPVAEQHVEDAARKRPLVYDKGGDAHYDFISAFIKSMRGSDPDAAVYYLAAMLEGGEDARFIARRMIVLASEDIGNADPQALLVAVAAAQAVEHVGLPEARLNLAQAAVYLAR
ncbi:MAG TPA: replication-associated recombination protein A, partial [Solirubrobacterales bacterium]|nr:replication-associated recombination protein A [Solirubrobacterales bacterium]